MYPLVGVAGAALVAIVLWEGFETVVLPRRVTRRIRLTRLFFRFTWLLWGGIVRGFDGRRRERFLGTFGPLSMIVLLVFWGLGLILGFAMLQWALGSQLSIHGERGGFPLDLYMSGTTFATLGLGDVIPATPAARLLTVIEAGTGFGFLALVIGYLPVLYQNFSRREVASALLDARAGSPSTPVELLRRHAQAGRLDDLDDLFRGWERWAAELLESHISYPVLCYYRSQHSNQSWLATLTTMLDTCALAIAGLRGVRPWQAQLTFAMARHAAVDMAQIFNTPPRAPSPDRLPPDALAHVRALLAAEGVELADPAGFDARLARLRHMYEPYAAALAGYLRLPVPAWYPASPPIDNWRTSAWERRSTGLPPSLFDSVDDEHSR